MKELRIKFLIVGSLVFGVLALISALTFGNGNIEVLTEKYGFESKYANTNIDFVIPSPSDVQVLELEGNESIGVNTITPYYVTEIAVTINQNKTVASNTLLFGYPEKMGNTPYSVKRIVSGDTSFGSGDAIIDSIYAERNRCRIGDSITIFLLGNTYNFTVAAIAEANPDYQNGSIALVLSEADNKYLVNHGVKYSSAYTSASDYEHLKEYLLNKYKPLGRLKDATDFASEDAYNLHVSNFNAADWSKEITLYKDNYKTLSVKYSSVDENVRQSIAAVCAIASVGLIAFAVVSLVLPGIKNAVMINLRKNKEMNLVKQLYMGGMLYNAFVFALVYSLALIFLGDVERGILHPYFAKTLWIPLVAVAAACIVTIIITSAGIGIIYRSKLGHDA